MIVRYLITIGFVLNIALVVKSRPANDDKEDSISTEAKQSDSSQKNLKHPTISNRKWYITEKKLPEKNIREIPVDVIYDLEVKKNIYEIRNVSKFSEISNKSNKKVLKEFIVTKNIENSFNKSVEISNSEKIKSEKLLNEKEVMKDDREKTSQRQNFVKLEKPNESNSEKVTAKSETEKKENAVELNPIKNKVNNTKEIYDKIVQNKSDISSNVKREINKMNEFDNLDITENITKKLVENKEDIDAFHLNGENKGNKEFKLAGSQPGTDKEISSNVTSDTLIENESNSIGIQSGTEPILNNVNLRKSQEKYFEKSTPTNEEKTQPTLDQSNTQIISNLNYFNNREINSNSIIQKPNFKETNQNKFDSMPLSTNIKYNNQDNTTPHNLKIKDDNFKKSNQTRLNKIPSNISRYKNQEKFNAFINTLNIREGNLERANQYKIERIPSRDKIFQEKSDSFSKYNRPEKYFNLTDVDQEKSNTNSTNNPDESIDKISQSKIDRVSSHSNRYKYPEKSDAFDNFKLQEENLDKSTRNQYEKIPSYIDKLKNQEKFNSANQEEGARKHSQYKIEKVPITKFSDIEKLNLFNFNTRESGSTEKIPQNKDEPISSNLNRYTLEDGFQGDQTRNNCVTHTIILNAPENIQGGAFQHKHSHSEPNAEELDSQHTQPKPQEEQHSPAQKLQISNSFPLHNTAPTIQYPWYNPSHPAPNQFLFQYYDVPNWQNFDRRIPSLANLPQIPYIPYVYPNRPLNSITNQPPLPYFNDVRTNNDFIPVSPYHYGDSPRKSDIAGESDYSVASWNSVPPIPLFDRSYRNDEIYPGSNFYWNLAYHRNNHPSQLNYYNNLPTVPNNYEIQGPFPHYAPFRASSPLSNYFPIVVHDPVKQFYTYLHDLVQYGPDADVCKFFKKFKKPFSSEKDKEDNVFEETNHGNKIQRSDDDNENDEENFSDIDLLRLKPRKGIVRDVDRSRAFNRPLRGKRHWGEKRRRVLKRKYRNAPLNSNETSIGSEVKDLNSSPNEEYRSLPTLGRPRKKRNAVSDDELFLSSDQQPTKYSLSTSNNILTKIPTENPFPSSYFPLMHSGSNAINDSSKDSNRQTRLFHLKGVTKSNSKNRVKVYDLEDEILGKGLGFNLKDHFRKDAINASDPNLLKVDTGPTIRKIKVRHGGVAIAGPGGIATAGSGGTAIVGPGGSAYTNAMPGSIAMVGPGGKVVPILDPYQGFYRNSPLWDPPMTAPENAGMLSAGTGPSGKTMQLTDGYPNITDTSRMFPQANTLVIPAGARLLTTGPVIYYNPVYPIRESRQTTNVIKGR